MMADSAQASPSAPDDFRNAFELLTGHAPFPWQEKLFTDWLAQARIPKACDIPTGLGKTSVVAVWLIALATTGQRLPRRLVYVVNRRTVVDQATREVERLRENLPKAGLTDRLGRLCATVDGPPLAISTLRGQHADNGQWYADPARPAIICGTVDMIGSRLLFGGYRIGFKSRPLHAGFLAQDSLLVHDESHLEPAFQKLIETIRAEQSREKQRAGDRTGDSGWRGLHVMALSATARGSDGPTAEPDPRFALTDEELNPPKRIPDPPERPVHHVWRRLKATKQLRLHRIEDEKQTPAKVTELAMAHGTSGAAVLVYLRTVDGAMKVADGLVKELKKAGLPQHVRTLTGTMRGHEREQLLRCDGVFARFTPSSSQPEPAEAAVGTVYLVCTSAGEVGVDISADHMVCDLSTFDSMAQRFGRVNRFGDRLDTRIEVVHPKKFGRKNKKTGKVSLDEMDKRRQRTLALLRRLPEVPADGDDPGAFHDASPGALMGLAPDARQDAFAPEPTIPPATDILFDAWAMTTIRGDMPGRPAVGPYLHGLTEWEPPRTKVAWRHEVDAVSGELLEYYGDDLPVNLLDDYPLKPHELLSDTSERVHKQLAEIDKRTGGGCPLWIVEDGGEVEVSTVGDLLRGERKIAVRRIADRTVLLPPSVGGLTAQGMLNGKAGARSPRSNELDVADLWLGEEDKPRRHRTFSGDPLPTDTPEGMTLIRTIDTRPLADELAAEEGGESLQGEDPTIGGDFDVPTKGTRFWHWFARPRDTDDATKASSQPLEWGPHVGDVVGWAERIADKLVCCPKLKKAIVVAARWHDLGKKRILWQRSIGNPEPDQWYAKGGKPPGSPPWRPRRLSDYRHEFGSLLDATDPRQAFGEELASLSDDEDTRDVVLHLIAAHHGFARPHFPPEATVDPNHSQSVAEEAALEVPRRYAQLQHRFGRWGLAYLESLLRAADWTASANPSSGMPAGEGGEQ